MALRVRAMSEDEKKTMRQLAHSRTAQARTGERARIVWLAHHSQRVRAIAQALLLTPTTVRSWLKRFKGAALGRVAMQTKFARAGKAALS
jgi:predicted ArsR family transcriptional regulator